jgi:hypothetical protein
MKNDRANIRLFPVPVKTLLKANTPTYRKRGYFNIINLWEQCPIKKSSYLSQTGAIVKLKLKKK